MSYIPITDPQSIDLPVNTGETATHTLTNVPQSATEVLIYFFVSVRDSTLPEVTRSFYEYTTSEGDVSYTKYMNVIFTKGDYVMNSENIWFPVSGLSEKTITIKLNEGFPWPAGSAGKKPRHHKNIREAMKDFNSVRDSSDSIFAEFFVIGYRN